MKSIPTLLILFVIAGFQNARAVEGDVGSNARPDRRSESTSHSTEAAKLGINLAGPVDWNTELPVVDVFRLSRTWISQRNGKSWGKGPALKTDENGWVTHLEPNCAADAMICTIEGGHFPSGRYTVLYEGEGAFRFKGSAKIVKQSPGRMEIEIDSKRGGFYLHLTEVNPQNYIRNIHVIMPGFENNWRDNLWHPEFLRRWKGFACLRFMDFMHTNGSTIKTWSDRPTIEDATWTPHGFPVEMLCDLANRLECDAWFCMPHAADDEFVREFAMKVKAHLDPERKVYIEYSNEVWNGIFAQNKYAAKRGQELGFAEKPWEAAWKFTGYRSKQIFRIWRDVFRDNDRLVRVLATQSANPFVTQQVAEFQNAWRSADALAIAPYFGWNVKPDEAPAVLEGGIEGVLAHLEKESLPKAFDAMRKQKKLADKMKLQLICYEAGQHLVGLQSAQHNRQLTELLKAANQHPKMGELYTRYLDGWAQGGGGLMCIFSSVSGWGKSGSWGLLAYADDDPADSPKFSAVIEWARDHGQQVNGR